MKRRNQREFVALILWSFGWKTPFGTDVSLLKTAGESAECGFLSFETPQKCCQKIKERASQPTASQPLF